MVQGLAIILYYTPSTFTPIDKKCVNIPRGTQCVITALSTAGYILGVFDSRCSFLLIIA